MTEWERELSATPFKVQAIEDHWLTRLLFGRFSGGTVLSRIFIRREYFGTDTGVDILRHERVHAFDQHDFGIFFYLSYFLLLPTVLTMRAFWEWRGYREDLRSSRNRNRGADPAFQAYMMEFECQWVSDQFCGANYFFMFPFKKYMYRKCLAFYKSLP